MARRAAVGLALLVAFVLPGCATGRTVAGTATPPAADVAGLQAAAVTEPTVVDSAGSPLSAEHADVVRAVHAALAAGDLAALAELHVGEDWADQEALLRRPEVRAEVLQVLRTHPANLGEGYLYPGFTATGWSGPTDVADGGMLGVDPDTLPEPTSQYDGWQTAFFLDSAPPAVTSGDLQWRGIATLTGPDAAS